MLSGAVVVQVLSTFEDLGSSIGWKIRSPILLVYWILTSLSSDGPTTTSCGPTRANDELSRKTTIYCVPADEFTNRTTSRFFCLASAESLLSSLPRRQNFQKSYPPISRSDRSPRADAHLR